MTEAYIYDAVRTPFGRFGGALAGVRPDDLAALVIGEQVRRASALDPAAIDEVILGNANGAGEENRNVARMGTLLAGLPVELPGTTVNRLCGSSLDAAIIAMAVWPGFTVRKVTLAMKLPATVVMLFGLVRLALMRTRLVVPRRS